MGFISGLFNRIKNCFTWAWTYLWILWFILVVILFYILKGPLKLTENVSTATMFFNTLTPKFYVALTGTSSLISGLILIFEWWYFKKYGTSFIEQVSLNYISSNSDSNFQTNTSSTSSSSPVNSQNETNNSNRTNSESNQIVNSQTCNLTNSITISSSNLISSNSTLNSIPECKVWKNPMSLFRGAEYSRLTEANGKEPLTFYDMNLSAQDHQTFFTCEYDEGKADYEIMQRAWRERNPSTRITLANEALAKNSECTPALILLAEEEAQTIVDAEKLFKQALKFADMAYKKSLQAQEQGHNLESLHKRNTNVLIYLKRRLGMCARKLGKLKEAAKIFRDLVKEFPMMSVYNIHENLIEVLLEMQSYPDVQAVLSKYDDINLPKSATICYTAALLKARGVSDRFSPDIASKRGLNSAEISAVDAIHRAVEFNPHVPKYLLEMKSLILPPEHILKRGDSEAIAYAFFHLQHWKRVEGALNLLQCTWEGTFRLIPYPLEKGHLFHPYPVCTQAADRELLPAYHDVSVFPKKELPFFILFTAGLCSGTATLALLTYQYPDYTTLVAKSLLKWAAIPLSFLSEKIDALIPTNLIAAFTRI
ncbi:unnamed protein product [Brachionus calyciflorus]|uniref:Protein ST7 homolog n=1 Tax=Brachionus calyciflorus TaxID=104777 RepID=A0A814CEL9_9BILA|nr:unnamed protein product [Brachionus calyciflorus]